MYTANKTKLYRDKHSPLIRLAAARRAWYAAQESCVHWDYEEAPFGTWHPCCRALEDSYHELKAAKKAAAKVQS